MSPARFISRTAALLALVLGSTPARGADPAAAPVTGKLPEVSTVGTTPSFLTEAERQKLVLARREGTPRRTAPAARLLVPPGFRPPAETFETRVPAVGSRERTKPIQSAAEIAEREKERAR